MFNKAYACAGGEDSDDICFGENCCVCDQEADIRFDGKAYCLYCAPKCELCGRTALDQLDGRLYCHECLPNNYNSSVEVAKEANEKPASIQHKRENKTFVFQSTYYIRQNQGNMVFQERMGVCPQVFGRCVQCGRQKSEVVFRMIPYCFDCRYQ